MRRLTNSSVQLWFILLHYQ